MTDVPTFASRAIALRSSRRQALAPDTFTIEKDAVTGRHYLAQFEPIKKAQPAGEGPVAIVRAFYLANPDISRKEFMAELVEKRGLNKSMVSTRLSWLRTGRDPATRPHKVDASKAAS